MKARWALLVGILAAAGLVAVTLLALRPGPARDLKWDKARMIKPDGSLQH